MRGSANAKIAMRTTAMITIATIVPVDISLPPVGKLLAFGATRPPNAPNTGVMRLSVIVPATVPAPTLSRCLVAIEAAGADEILVADEPARPTPSLARNRAVDRATGAVLAFAAA